jgi:hypothetical protein
MNDLSSSNADAPTTPDSRGSAPGSGSAFSLWECAGARGWRYRLLHWLCGRWGYFPVPLDAPEAAGWLPSTAALQYSWSEEKVGRALAMGEVERELIAWRAGVQRPNEGGQP